MILKKTGYYLSLEMRNKKMGNPFFILVFCLFFFSFSACRIHKEIAKNSPPKTKPKEKKIEKPETSDAKFARIYSEKLHIQLTGKENKKLVENIADWYGVPHKIGGCDKSGIDCSCFVANVFKSVYNINLARISESQYKECKPVSRVELKEGDLVFFKINSPKISHVGIYLSDGKFAHASTSKGVIINSLEEEYYKKYFFMGGRISR